MPVGGLQGPDMGSVVHQTPLTTLPLQVDILIVNCSLFNPTPSLSAMIVNHFKFKSNVITYNLSGMGCSAGVIAVSLARELLQVTITAHCSCPWDLWETFACPRAFVQPSPSPGRAAEHGWQPRIGQIPLDAI